jgi:type II secretion system protein J
MIAPGSRGALAAQRGFTLLELVVAMAVFGLVGLGIFGVLVLGARSAGSGERVTEQARRYRIANDVISRQIAAVEPIQLPQPDEEGLDDEDEGEGARPFFYGDAETLEFVTTAPQRPDASGMAIVRYWVEDGTLKMSERPVLDAYAAEGLDRRRDEDDAVATTLLYDVESVTFSYQRESDSDEWVKVWDAREEEQLPACVRIDVRPSAVGGPDFYHEIPVMVGTFNQISDAESDFRSRRVRRGGRGEPPVDPNPSSSGSTPTST